MNSSADLSRAAASVQPQPRTGNNFLPILRTLLAAGLLVLLVSGCAERSPRPTSPELPVSQPRPDEGAAAARAYSGGPAHALYEDAARAMAAGAFDQAELSLERALRIAPDNAYYWYAMAKVKHRQGADGQALQFCLKSKSLAGRDARLIRMNDDLMAEIR